LPNKEGADDRQTQSRPFYQVSAEDRTINPDLERFMAKRMNAKTIELSPRTDGV